LIFCGQFGEPPSFCRFSGRFRSRPPANGLAACIENLRLVCAPPKPKPIPPCSGDTGSLHLCCHVRRLERMWDRCETWRIKIRNLSEVYLDLVRLSVIEDGPLRSVERLRQIPASWLERVLTHQELSAH